MRTKTSYCALLLMKVTSDGIMLLCVLQKVQFYSHFVYDKIFTGHSQSDTLLLWQDFYDEQWWHVTQNPQVTSCEYSTRCTNQTTLVCSQIETPTFSLCWTFIRGQCLDKNRNLLLLTRGAIVTSINHPSSSSSDLPLLYPWQQWKQFTHLL